MCYSSLGGRRWILLVEEVDLELTMVAVIAVTLRTLESMPRCLGSTRFDTGKWSRSKDVREAIREGRLPALPTSKVQGNNQSMCLA